MSSEYTDPLNHLLDEVVGARLGLRRLELTRAVRRSLEGRGGLEPDNSVVDELAEASERVALHRQVVADGVAATSGRLPLRDLADRLALDAAEQQVVSTLLAVELDPTFARRCGALSDDVVRPEPTVGLLLELLGPDLTAQEAVRDALAPGGVLRRLRIVLVEGDRPDVRIELSFMRRRVKLAERVVDHLRGRDAPDPAIAGFVRIAGAPLPLDALVVNDRLRADAAGVAKEGADDPGAALRLHLHGPEGSGRKALVGAVLRARAGADSVPQMLVADWSGLLDEPVGYFERLALLAREAVLSGRHLHLEAHDEVPEVLRTGSHALRLAGLLDGLPCGVSLAAADRLPQVEGRVAGLLSWELPLPDPEARGILWARALQGKPVSEQVDPVDLGHKYVLTGGGIGRAAAAAARRAAQRGAKSRITATDIEQDSQLETSRGLVHLADRVEKWFTFDDAVLSEETLDGLEAMLGYARHRRFVLDEWGFRRLLPYGQGLGVLFTGPPGTGKTMCASIVARELGMELYRVDLSRVVNKYIGETEKNLARIFDEARGGNCVLLFDEADAMFARRTEVRTSVDRYANLEVNYLLQRMEQHDGVTVLTTNFEGSIDKAFRRRLKFHIQFPTPKAKERTLLWKAMIPAEADVEAGIRFDQLGKEFEFTGGYIKNAIVRAAVMARELEEPISEELLFEAADREARESGRLVRGQASSLRRDDSFDADDDDDEDEDEDEDRQ